MRTEKEGVISRLLRRIFPHKDIGWSEIGEEFTRYTILKTRWFNVFLHQLYAPQAHDDCHDHPWSFLAILLWSGYAEQVGSKWHRRRPGSVLWRPAEFAHNVVTPYGTSWSIIITGAKRRDWGFKTCQAQ